MAPRRTRPPQPLAPHGIPGHLVEFVEALRRQGISVGPSETVDAGQVMATLGLGNREVLREGLRPFADVQNVTRLNEVHDALSAGPLDVIILDWTVPDGDAAAVLDDIAELQPTARVVGLTSDAARARDSRVGTHLVKSQTDLNHIIESIVGPTQRAS